ncbi:Thiol-disulfide isomerase or thioredoxin [Hyunsoonleella jejuensis]|uniref:Thiol-disulfide isomerase or thioredoxin n=1 Tax=Hyunsoonleella jejuensis TaxID=419940 RepID=A0A1H9BWN2_9FLAO|nr:thioredoxin family protein [Hyunsoonleella jejuensis]SEP93304.1 Thiol-disulfide isomerase or thioredoxin [Hyunsoonleella jejuensis]
MKTIIESGIKKSMPYQAYRDLVEDLVEKRATTGHEQSTALINYTKLNAKRMRRWDKTLKVSDAAKKRLSKFDMKVTWLVITESWCGDAAHILPVLNKIAEMNPNINYRLVLRDENPKLMDAFLTYGNRAIPKLIIIDNATGNILNTYGPRPSEATGFVNRFKAMNGTLTESFKQDLQHWYNDNKGQNVIDDITEILSQLQSATVYQ